MKYSMTAARLLPIQDTKTPTHGPKMAPFRMTIGSVGMGVAERIPIKRMENKGPAMPALGMCCSIFFKSLAKRTIRAIGMPKEITAMRMLRMFLARPFFINNSL